MVQSCWLNSLLAVGCQLQSVSEFRDFPGVELADHRIGLRMVAEYVFAGLVAVARGALGIDAAERVPEAREAGGLSFPA